MNSSAKVKIHCKKLIKKKMIVKKSSKFTATYKTLTKNIKDGTGVEHWTFINDIAAGKCPFLAPTKNKRDDANIAPFNEPNVEHATNNGINHAI